MSERERESECEKTEVDNRLLHSNVKRKWMKEEERKKEIKEKKWEKDILGNRQ